MIWHIKTYALIWKVPWANRRLTSSPEWGQNVSGASHSKAPGSPWLQPYSPLWWCAPHGYAPAHLFLTTGIPRSPSEPFERAQLHFKLLKERQAECDVRLKTKFNMRMVIFCQDSLFFFSRSLSRLMTSRRLTLSLSDLKPPGIIAGLFSLLSKFQKNIFVCLRQK